jgi:uncharacterized repeat protein (TIGR03809 family)
MSKPVDRERGQSVMARWQALAQRRLDHLTELFESGRWQLYHSEVEFFTMIEEAKAAVKTWTNLVPADAVGPENERAGTLAADETDTSAVVPSADGIISEDNLRES